MLSNAYFLAKFRFDTAENEPAKHFQKNAKFANFANRNLRTCTGPSDVGGRAVPDRRAHAAPFGKLRKVWNGLLKLVGKLGFGQLIGSYHPNIQGRTSIHFECYTKVIVGAQDVSDDCLFFTPGESINI